MKNLTLIFSACVIAVLNGCAMQTADEREVGVTGQSLTLQECEDQRDECIDRGGLLGLAFCNLDFQACALTSDNGLPSEVADAAAGAIECTTELDDCILAANTPSELTACAETEAECVANVLDVDLPAFVDGTGVCVDSAVECIDAAQSANELLACGEGLGQCAVEQVEAVVPAAVADTIGDAVACADELTSCIQAAQRPSELAACNEANVACVADTLGVALPDVPAGDVVECAEAAAECTLEVSSLDDVQNCADDLVGCGQAVVDSLNAPNIIDCNIQFNTCLLQNPFQFGMCAEQLRACQ